LYSHNPEAHNFSFQYNENVLFKRPHILKLHFMDKGGETLTDLFATFYMQSRGIYPKGQFQLQ